MIEEAADYLGIGDPFFRVHEGIAGAETVIGNRSYVNFASYNYIGLNGDPRALPRRQRRRSTATAPRSRPAVRFPASARSIASSNRRWRAFTAPRTASRWSAGMRPMSRSSAICSGRNDVIVHDALIHNSIVQGAILSGARRVPFSPSRSRSGRQGSRRDAPAPWPCAARHRGALQHGWRRAPIWPRFVAVARRHGAWLMVDEAHALGVLGPRGFGSADHAGIDPGRGRHLDGDAQQEPGLMRRIHRRPPGSDRLPEADGAGLCVLGRHGAAGRRRRRWRRSRSSSASRSGCAG